MHLIRLIYASKISSICDLDHVEGIIASCKKNNPAMGITGVLCYNNDYFIQCLEGSRKNVNHLYHMILSDKRHYDSAILSYEEIDQRDFNRWSMGYIPPSYISGDVVQKYSGDTKLVPYSMSGKSVHLLLKELSQSGIASR